MEKLDEISSLLDSVPEIDDNMNILKKIGHGTFSSVYLGQLKKCNSSNKADKQFAIKHIIPTSHPSRIFMEVKCLKLLG